MFRFEWEAFVDEALLRGLAVAARVPAGTDLDPIAQPVVTILGHVGGLPFVERVLDADERRAAAERLLGEAVQRTLRLVAPSTERPGFWKEKPRKGIPLDSVIAGARSVPVNRASEEVLAALPVFGRVTARRIVEARAAGGPFQTFDDLGRRVQGLNATELAERLADALVFDGPGDVARARFRATGVLGTDLARLVELQEGEDPLPRLRAALLLVATHCAATPHPATLRHERRDLLPRPAPPPPMASAEWIAVLEGSQYYANLPDLLGGATKRIDVCMFHAAMSTEDHPTRRLLDALVAAKDRRVAVRVLLDQDRPEDPYGSAIINAPAKAYLEGHGVPCRYDTKDGLLHSKWVAIDGSFVVLGSHNWSAGSYFHFDDISLAIRSPALAAGLTKRLDAMWGRA